MWTVEEQLLSEVMAIYDHVCVLWAEQLANRNSLGGANIGLYQGSVLRLLFVMKTVHRNTCGYCAMLMIILAVS